MNQQCKEDSRINRLFVFIFFPSAERGRISFGLYLRRYSGDIDVYIKQAYDAHLDGPCGPNTSIRKFSDREKIDISELSHRLVKSPETFKRRTINGLEYLFWHVENEFSEKSYTYFLHVIDEKRYLSFRFNHYFSAQSEEVTELNLLVSKDIENFMIRVFNRSKN